MTDQTGNYRLVFRGQEVAEILCKVLVVCRWARSRCTKLVGGKWSTV